MKTITFTILTASMLVGPACLGQNYRCDWNVVGSGGGSMASTSYRADATAGQTAVGNMGGTSFLAIIGFWQADYQVGIRERKDGVSPGRLVTELHAPAPNPFSHTARIRYSLANASRVRLQTYDLSGRIVSTLVDTDMDPGQHDIAWHGDDGRRQLPAGVYFVRLRADGTDTVQRVLLTH